MRTGAGVPFVASVLVLSCVCLPTLPAAPPATSASRPGAVPASRPSADAYPSKELTEACKTTAAELRPKLGEAFSITISPPFVVAGNMPAARLQDYASGSVTRPAEVLWKSYFRKRPEKAITILLFVDGGSYAAWAKKLFGDEGVSHFGYYKPQMRTMVMDISTGSGTLVHELTHALLAPDFPGVPDWFNEGLASLHEGCQIERNRIVGLVNWRLPALKDAIEKGKLRPLEELLTADDFYGEKRGLNYAQARYFCMYAQSLGLLEKLYARLRDSHEGPRSGVDAVEAVFGKKIGQVEKEYLAWVKGLR